MQLLNRNSRHIPESVTVDPVFSARKSLFYTQVLQDQKELFARGRYANAKAVLESLGAPGISYGRADTIKAAAGKIGLEIIDPQPAGHGPSIAVDANSEFGPSHRVAITESIYSMGLYKSIMTVISNNPGEFVGFDLMMVLLYGLIQNVANHPPVNGQWWAMNRRGIPTFLLYSAAAAATWGTCLYVQGLCADNMRQNNYSSASVRFATSAAAFGIALTTI